MLRAFWRAYVVFIQGNLLLARSIQLIRNGPPWMPRSASTVIRQERSWKFHAGRVQVMASGASKARRYALCVRQQD
jgi:hypothetical protein